MENEKILTGEGFYQKRGQLTLLKQCNWENYYIDPLTNEKWIEEFVESALHGGGPPRLRLIDNYPWE